MKNLLLVLIVIITFASCKKDKSPTPTSSNAPATPPPTTNTWAAVNFTIDNQVSSMTSIGTNIFIGTGTHGVFKSTDNGISWISVNNGLSSTDTTVSCKVYSNGSTLYLVTTYEHKIYQSTNNGASWLPIWNYLVNSSSYPAIKSLNFFGSTILIGSAGTVYKSTDNGVNWAQQTIPITSPAISAPWFISFATDGTNIFAATDNSNIFKSINNGSTFNPLINDSINGGYFKNVVGIGSKIFVASEYSTGRKPVYMSTNSGNNWLPVSTGITSPFSLMHIYSLTTDNTNLFVSLINQVFVSNNDGASWNQLGGDIPGSSGVSQKIVAFTYKTGGYVYAITNANGIYKVAY